MKYITYSSVLVSNGNYLVNDIQCKGTDVRITEGSSRNLLRNVSSSRYKFNAERRLRVTRMQLQQQCACVCVCVCVCARAKKRKIHNAQYGKVGILWDRQQRSVVWKKTHLGFLLLYFYIGPL
jgi:hypothetical protein